MRRSTWFWGILLILIGVLLLLNNLGFLNVNIWGLVGSALLVGLGLWILWGVVIGRPITRTEAVTIPLEGARRAHLRVQHGAGRLRVGAGAGADELVTGTFGGGLDYRARRDGDALNVRMRVPDYRWSAALPWHWGQGGNLDWSFGLNGEIPLSLTFETGASDMQLDLTDLRVTELQLKTGASSTDVTLPANAGHTSVSFSGGAASAIIRVPSGVAARVRTSGGLADIKVDRNRFPRLGGIYQSEDYDAAPNKADIRVEMGVGSINVR